MGSSLRSWIHTSACSTHCEGDCLLISNASPIDFAFYISLEAKLFWIWDRAPRNGCHCRTFRLVVDGDIEATFFALDDNDDFNVHFHTTDFNFVNICIFAKRRHSTYVSTYCKGVDWLLWWFASIEIKNTCDIRERNVTMRKEIQTKKIRSLGFWDIKEWMVLWKMILWNLRCTPNHVPSNYRSNLE